MATGTQPSIERRRIEIAFRRRFRRAPQVLVRAPGRVALLGGHVDHQEGWVLPGAIEPAVWLAAAARADRRARLVALDLGEERELDLERLPPPRRERPDGASSWSDYPAGVARELAALAGDAAPGLDAVFGGDLPRGAGVSSSAAVEMAFLLAWQRFAGLHLEPAAAARLGRRVENDYLDVASGVMDQMACLLGRTDHLVLVDCRTLDFERLGVPPGHRVLLFDSGVRRRLVGSAFNDRRRECDAALAALRRRRPELKSLRDIALDELDDLAAAGDGPPLAGRPLARARHVVEECARVRSAAGALGRGDLATLGRAMNASHASSRDLFEVSLPELDLLAAAAAGADGCLGARLCGGGFGGAVCALVAQERAETVAAEVATAFERRFGRRPPSLSTALANGAHLEEAAR